MKKMNDSEKSKMKAISLSPRYDEKLLAIGDGSRTAGIKELLELYEVVERLGGKSVSENKEKLIVLIHELMKKAS